MSAIETGRTSAPDLVEPIVGFRQWRLADRALTSLFSDVPWRHQVLRASCRAGVHDPADAPVQGCSCGIYAYYDPCPRTASAGTPDFVGGVVVVWGRVELHATGMRAAHARVVALELPLSRAGKRRRVLQVAEALGVQAVAHRDLRSVAREYGAPMSRSLRPPRRWVSAGEHQPIGVLPRAVSSAFTATRKWSGTTASGPTWGPFLIGVLIIAIGEAFGSNSGWAINPARDFGPRLFEFIAGWSTAWKAKSGSLYFWVPIIGPLIGGLIGAFIYDFFIGRHLPEVGDIGPGHPEYVAPTEADAR